MKKLIPYFFDGYHLQRQSLWFKRGLYLLVLAKVLVWLFYFNLYFGPNSILYSRPASISGIKGIAFFLYAFPAPWLALFFIVLLSALCLFSLLLPRIYFLPGFLIWLLVTAIHNRLYATLTGGDYLLNQFLFFSCFLSSVPQIRNTRVDVLKRCGHNLAVWAVFIQVCMVYFFSALAKCSDPQWLAGTAVSSIARVHHYSGNLSFGASGALAKVLNYGAFFYQLLFPVLVWIKKIKKPFICLGILMHLYIAFIVGLPWFGLIMILAYVYFWPFQKLVR